MLRNRCARTSIHLISSPSSGIIDNIIVSVFVSVFISTISPVIIAYNGCLLVVLIATVSVIIDDGLVLNDGILTTAVIAFIIVLAALLVTIITATFEIIFEFFLVSVPVLLCDR